MALSVASEFFFTSLVILSKFFPYRDEIFFKHSSKFGAIQLSLHTRPPGDLKATMNIIGRPPYYSGLNFSTLVRESRGEQNIMEWGKVYDMMFCYASRQNIIPWTMPHGMIFC